MLQTTSVAIRSFATRHHRGVFFLALYLVYLIALFGFSGVRDTGHWTRTIARLVAPLVELGLIGLLCAACMRMARRGRRWPWLALCAAIAGFVAVVYLVQVYSLYVSNNFVSVLALQNTDSAAFVVSPLFKAGVAATIAWMGLFCAAVVVAGSDPSAVQRGTSERWSPLRFGMVAMGLGVLFLYLLSLQNKNMRLEPGFRQTPVANLAANLYSASSAPQFEAVERPASKASEVTCFRYGGDPESSDYPFQQTKAYQAALPFARRGASNAKPNIVVVFAEGVSARLVGAYGGHYPQLTPGIDRLAAQSMRVDDYYNHTAATYRALSGQLSSGYSYAGGGGEGGWTKPGTESSLSSIRRQTLPRIANTAGYDSYFFAPHKTRRPVITMLRSLGFGKVYAYESIAQELVRGEVAERPGTSGLDDQSLFRGLTQFLKRRAASNDDKPFFVGIYNIGTHAFLTRSDNDIAYGDGENPVLDKVHNYDAALGEFLRYFYGSPYADNTILVFTSDHATYPESAYRDVAGDDFKAYFVDRIPLLIRDPFHRLPDAFSAEGRTSLDLAPTVLHLAGLQTDANSFLGTSIFEPRNFPTGVAALGPKYFMTTPDEVFLQNEIPPAMQETFNCEMDVVRRFYQAERENRIFRPTGEVGASTGK